MVLIRNTNLTKPSSLRQLLVAVQGHPQGSVVSPVLLIFIRANCQVIATREINGHIVPRVDGNRLPTIKTPNIIGVTFDTMLTFNAHANIAGKRMKARKHSVITGCHRRI